MTSKTFAVAGVSIKDGKYKARFANDVMRTKILVKTGHTNIQMETLPREMTKGEAVAHLIAIGLGQDQPEIATALQAAAKKYGVTAVVTAVVPEAEAVAE
jgi:hypothetical protein